MLLKSPHTSRFNFHYSLIPTRHYPAPTCLYQDFAIYCISLIGLCFHFHFKFYRSLLVLVLHENIFINFNCEVCIPLFFVRSQNIICFHCFNIYIYTKKSRSLYTYRETGFCYMVIIYSITLLEFEFLSNF